MTATPFAERFAAEGEAGDPQITYDDTTLRQLWRTKVGAGRIGVHRREASGTRRQGLVIEADDELCIGDHRASRFVLWADRAPEDVTVVVPDPTEIRIWNVWSDDGWTNAWIGWSAIQVDEDDDAATLRCNDGHAGGEIPFTDLVVEITLDPDDSDRADA